MVSFSSPKFEQGSGMLLQYSLKKVAY